jgi:hypothetical protein
MAPYYQQRRSARVVLWFVLVNVVLWACLFVFALPDLELWLGSG